MLDLLGLEFQVLTPKLLFWGIAVSPAQQKAYCLLVFVCLFVCLCLELCKAALECWDCSVITGLFVVLEMEPRASHWVGMHSTMSYTLTKAVL